MTSLDLRVRAATLALLAGSIIVLSGCAPTTPEASNGNDANGDSTGETEEASAGKGPKCEDNTTGVELFTADGVSNAPEYGQVWGDGSELSFDYDGFVEGATLDYEISYVQDNGSVIPVTGGFFGDPSGTTFSSSDLYFDSTSEGYYGIVDVGMTSNVEFDGDKYTGDSTDVAVFCVILKTSD